MTWTRERPTMPRLYWVRKIGGGDTVAGPVVELCADMEVQGIGSDRSAPIEHPDFDDCEWAPAEPPP